VKQAGPLCPVCQMPLGAGEASCRQCGQTFGRRSAAAVPPTPTPSAQMPLFVTVVLCVVLVVGIVYAAGYLQHAATAPAAPAATPPINITVNPVQTVTTAPAGGPTPTKPDSKPTPIVNAQAKPHAAATPEQGRQKPRKKPGVASTKRSSSCTASGSSAGEKPMVSEAEGDQGGGATGGSGGSDRIRPGEEFSDGPGSSATEGPIRPGHEFDN